MDPNAMIRAWAGRLSDAEIQSAKRAIEAEEQLRNNHGAHSAATPGPCDLSGITADKPSKGRGIPPAYSRELTLSQMRDLHPGASFTLRGRIIEATENGRTVRAETYREVHNQMRSL